MRCSSRAFRPRLEPLEPRLPPGDAVVGAALTLAGLTSDEPRNVADSLRESAGTRGASALHSFCPEALTLADQSFVLLPDQLTARVTTARRATEAVEGTAERRPRLQPAPQTLPDSAAGFASGMMAFVSVAMAAQPFNPVVTQTDTNAALLQAVVSLPPPVTQSVGVHALFDLSTPESGPFPSNVFTVADDTQNTGRRVNLPLPDCGQRLSDCRDLNVINELDGFNAQPRLTIPFDGPLDVNSVTSATVFFVSLGSTLPHGGDPRGTVIGINQVVWDPATLTLIAESDALLAQHTRYALLVTTGVLDESGDPVEATKAFRNFRDKLTGDLEFYRDELLDGLAVAEKLGVSEKDIVTASVFTTQSTTAILEKIRDETLANPAPADFLLGSNGERTVYDLADVTRVRWANQTRVSPPGFDSQDLNLSLLQLVPGSVGQLAYGKFVSPHYLTPARVIPAVGTLTGVPEVQEYRDVYFNLILPSGERPEGGWPVAIFGHGTPSDKNVIPLQTAAKMAEHGIATLAINAFGHGYGPLGTLTVTHTGGPAVTFLDGGRGVDVNGDNFIGGQEGFSAGGIQAIINERDGKRQTVTDLMQLVRAIEVGMDVDGDGTADLDASRVSYFGRSYGGIYGTIFMGVEPNVGSGVLIVGGGAQMDARRLSAVNRGGPGGYLGARTPSLLNPPGLTHIGGLPVGGPRFDENIPLRNQPAVVNTVDGALAIQQAFDRHEWVALSGDPLGYAPHLRKAPLVGNPEKSVIIQFGLGDQNVPNPATTALLRAGDLADRAVYYRHDLAVAEDPRRPRNSHSFQIAVTDATMREIALGAQEQIGVFFASAGKSLIHPEPARFFEVPIKGPLPEEMNYLQ